MGKRTHEDFIEEVHLQVGDEYQVMGIYSKARIPIKMKHICGHEYMVSPDNFLRGRRCPSCKYKKLGKDKSKNFEEVKLLYKQKGLSLIEPINYENGESLLKVKCENNHEFEINYYETKRRNTPCPICSERRRYTYSEVQDYFDNEGCTLLSNKYSHSNNKLKYIATCGHERLISFEKFKDSGEGRKCKKCTKKEIGDNYRYSMEDLSAIYSKSDCILLSNEYETNKQKLSFICSCDRTDCKPLVTFMKNPRCRHCSKSSSNGEMAIYNFFNKGKINIEMEYTFKDCRNKLPLPFDVKIKEIDLIIEYDGEDHFIPSRRYKNKEKREIKFTERQNNDKTKNQYCIDNNISLIRVPYWEYNHIENILDHVLGYFKLIDKSDVDEKLVHKFLVNHPDWSHEEYIKQAK